MEKTGTAGFLKVRMLPPEALDFALGNVAELDEKPFGRYSRAYDLYFPYTGQRQSAFNGSHIRSLTNKMLVLTSSSASGNYYPVQGGLGGYSSYNSYTGAGYQLRQSLITIGSGGLFGLGYGKSRQKYLYLPFQYNDYIFAVICEELGLVGAMAIVALFAVTILRGYWIALHTRDRFGTLLVVGFTTQLAVQVFLNIGVVTGLLPTTGISLPFFSYGGTALLIQLAEMGVILSVSRQMKPTKAG